MTYKELVNNIKQIVQDHYILVDFGYGQISDIKTGGDDGEADYPYAFLNPGSHTRGERSITYRFNLIVMDMYLGDDFLTAQSQCQQYIDDILAEMKYGTQDYDININATLTPFKERFQDVVGGMTATLEIEVGQKLNLCIAPIQPDYAIQLDVASTQDQLFRPDVAQSPLKFQDIILDLQGPWESPTYTGWRNPGNNFYKPAVAGTWRFVLTGEVVLHTDQGDWPDSPDLIHSLNSIDTLTAPTTTNWPSQQPAVGETIPFECVWEDYEYTPVKPGNPNDDYLAWNWIDEPQPEDIFTILQGAKLKGYYRP